MLMKKWIAFLLVLLTLASPLCVTAASVEPALTILAVERNQQEVLVHYCLQSGGKAREITCLVTDEKATPLYVGQMQSENGVQTIVCPLTDSPEKLTVQLGGSGIGTYRSVALQTQYESSFLFFSSGQTVDGLKSELSQIADLAVMNGEDPVTDEQLLTADFVAEGTWSEKSVRWNLVLAGDVSADGQVSAVDALYVLQHIVGKRRLEGNEKIAADFRQSGKIEATNALMILQYVVGKIATL